MFALRLCGLQHGQDSFNTLTPMCSHQSRICLHEEHFIPCLAPSTSPHNFQCDECTSATLLWCTVGLNFHRVAEFDFSFFFFRPPNYFGIPWDTIKQVLWMSLFFFNKRVCYENKLRDDSRS